MRPRDDLCKDLSQNKQEPEINHQNMQHRKFYYHHHVMLFLLFLFIIIPLNGGSINIGIGVILDMESSVGKTSAVCINMAIHDFYQTHNNYTTRITPHFRDSKYDRVEAASAAIQLLKDVKVMAIIGPQRSSQADFVLDIGNKAHVPILSTATTPCISPNENPYFIRISHNSSSQAQPIADLIKSFNWRDVVFVYQDDDFGSGFIPYMSQALLDIGSNVKHRSVISQFASDDAISEELFKLKKMQTRVFVVHLLPYLASRFFKKAKEAGMMKEGYVWIITDVVTSLLHNLDPSDIDAMQGVVGVKPYIPRSDNLDKFEKRWKRRKNPTELDVYGLWSYDITYALAMALERVGSDSTFTLQAEKSPITDLDAIGTSKLGSRLLSEIHDTRLKGLTGDLFVVDGQLQSQSHSLDYQIVNIIGHEVKQVDLWTPNGFKMNSLKSIVWPGGRNHTPQGWAIPPTQEKKLRVGFPAKGGFAEFINGTLDEKTNETKPTGFCVDVFEAVMRELTPAPPYEYKHFDIKDGEASGSYDDLVYQIVLEEYDVVIGDVTIRSNRSNYVDFTLPYTESGISMIVPIKVDDRKDAWIFMRPLEKQLWLTTCAFFIYTGVVVWVLEHQVNKDFRGRPYKQVGMIFWFSFSTLVFAHKEKMINNLSRLVVVVWIFVVLVLQSSYIASLTSMMTLRQLQPDFTDIYDLMRQGDNVGYKDGSYVAQMLKGIGFEDAKLKNYSSLQDYDDALSRGSKNGGVSAIFDELPYVELFLSKYCNKYMMVGPTYKTAGFGFAFPKGSPLVAHVSKAVLQVTERNLSDIANKWLGKEANCSEQKGGGGSMRLSLHSFKGLFLIAGVSSTSALVIYMMIFLYENRGMMLGSESSVTEKLSAIVKTFGQEKQLPSNDDDDDDDFEFLEIEDYMSSNTPPTPENHIATTPVHQNSC